MTLMIRPVAMVQSHVTLRGWLIFMGALIYAYIYILRIQPGAMLIQLMEAYHLSVTDLAQIVTVYLPLYLLLQLPMGILLDRYGCKKILIMSLCCCIVGIHCLNQGESPIFLLLGRLLIGIGSAPVYLSVLKLALRNISERYFSVAVGLISTFSMLVAYRGDQWIAQTVVHYSWQLTNDILAGIGCLLLIIVCFSPSIDSKPLQSQLVSWGKLWRECRLLVMDRRIIINMSIAGLLYTPLSLLAEFWGAYYVNLVHPNSPAHYSDQVSLFFIGWAFGAPLFGWLARWCGSERFLMLISSVITVVLLIALYAAFVDKESSMGVYFLFIGGAASCQVLVMSSAKKLSSESTHAVCFALTNTSIMLVNYLVQWIFTGLLSFLKDPFIVYWILPGSIFIAIGLLCFMTPNHRQQQYVVLSESD